MNKILLKSLVIAGMVGFWANASSLTYDTFYSGVDNGKVWAKHTSIPKGSKYGQYPKHYVRVTGKTTAYSSKVSRYSDAYKDTAKKLLGNSAGWAYSD